MNIKTYRLLHRRNLLHDILFTVTLLLSFAIISCTDEDTVSHSGTGIDGIHFLVDNGIGTRTNTSESSLPHCTDVNVHELKLPDGEKFFLEESEFDGFFENASITRGSQIETVADLGDFSTYCYRTDGTAYYENVAVGNDGILKERHGWPQGETLRFYAIHPYDASETNFSASATDFKYTYTVSTDVPAQSDLMYASTGEVEYNDDNLATLHFRHALTAVKVKVGTIGSSVTKINSITFKNVKTRGTITLPTTDTDASSSSSSTPGPVPPPEPEPYPTNDDVRNFSLTDLNHTTMAPGTEINGGEKTFLMKPQSLDDITLEIGVTLSDGNDYTFSKSLAGGNDWEAGKTRIYTFTTAAIMTINYPEGWEDVNDGSSVQGPVTTYDQGESFGLFSVNPATNQIVLSNIEVKNDVGGSASTLNLLQNADNNGKAFAYGNTYFLYYPYKSDSDLAALIGSDYNSLFATDATITSERAASAEDFFVTLRSNWVVSDTQNTLASFKAQDLQTGKLDYTGHKFEMEHQMGLAQLLTTVLLNDTWVWTFNSQTTHDVYSESIEDPDEVTIDKSKFNTTTKARLYDESGLWTIVKAMDENTNETVAFGCDFTNDDVELFIDGTDINNDEWNSTESNIGYGKHKEIVPNITHIPRKFRADFNYNTSKTYYTIILPRDNQTYKLETWGAGKGHNYETHEGNHGKGGYTYGNYEYVAEDVPDTEGRLFVCVGGVGIYTTTYSTSNAGYNGGGAGASGGHGATHIADILAGTGVLTAYSSSRDNVLIVAGGAGAFDYAKSGYGGHGGGGNSAGGDGKNVSQIASGGGISGLGSSGYTHGAGFGKGARAHVNSTSNDSAAGAGGGWYGGNVRGDTSTGVGGGGSGHINTEKVTDGGGSGTSGDDNKPSQQGFARISWPAPTE